MGSFLAAYRALTSQISNVPPGRVLLEPAKSDCVNICTSAPVISDLEHDWLVFPAGDPLTRVSAVLAIA